MGTDNIQVSITVIRKRGLINGGVFTLIFSFFYFLVFLIVTPFLIDIFGADFGGLVGKGLGLIFSMGAIIFFLAGLAQFVIGKPILFKDNLLATVEKFLK